VVVIIVAYVAVIKSLFVWGRLVSLVYQFVKFDLCCFNLCVCVSFAKIVTNKCTLFVYRYP